LSSQDVLGALSLGGRRGLSTRVAQARSSSSFVGVVERESIGARSALLWAKAIFGLAADALGWAKFGSDEVGGCSASRGFELIDELVVLRVGDLRGRRGRKVEMLVVLDLFAKLVDLLLRRRQ